MPFGLEQGEAADVDAVAAGGTIVREELDLQLDALARQRRVANGAVRPAAGTAPDVIRLPVGQFPGSEHVPNLFAQVAVVATLLT